ncbi:VOC family protein [Halobacteriales archaeon Cl-PHB]
MTGSDPPTAVRIDHVGIAVEDVADGEPLFELLGTTPIERGEGPGGAFDYHYFELGDASRIELIEPADDDTFLTAYLDDYGPGLHHVTLEVGDLPAMVAHLEANDVSVVDYAELADFDTAFVSPSDANGVLYQLVEYADSFEAPIGGCTLAERAGRDASEATAAHHRNR